MLQILLLVLIILSTSKIDVEHIRKRLAPPQSDADQQTGWFQDRVRKSAENLDAIDPEKDLREAIDTVYKARNLVRLKLSGIVDDEGKRLIPLADESLKDVPKLPIDEALIRRVAKSLFESARNFPGDKLMIKGSRENIQIVEEIARLCIENGVDFGIDIVHHELEAAIVNRATDAGMEALGREYCDYYDPYPAEAEARSNPDPSIEFAPDKLKRLSELKTPQTGQVQEGTKHYCLTVVPTPADATIDGLDYAEYLKLFSEACDQPWDEIGKAQERLIERLDAGKIVHITNSDRTDLTINIEGMTFVNSLTWKNYPGSEIFSAPVKDGVDGKLVAKGKFKYQNYPLIEDITLEFVKGRVVKFDARVGREILEKIITADDGQGEGTRFVGEFAVGTNPGLDRLLLNIIMGEKPKGSFHIALGDCYGYETYNGKPVKIKNGNVSKSGIHWDITTMLAGKDGVMELDGKVIQSNGVWVDETGKPDESLAVLNYGWAALPEEQRPE